MAEDKPENGANAAQAEGTEAAAPETDTPGAAEEVEQAPPPPEPNPLVSALLAEFPGVASEEGADTFGGPIVRVDSGSLVEVMAWLRDNEATKFDYLASLTAVDWTERTPRFDVVYHLYSIAKNHRITVKVGCADGEGVPTMSELWGTANWHEREAYDLYGVEFLGHPELERIFLPEDWEGFPLRKDYPLEGPNLELLTRQQAAFRGGRFDRIRGDYEMTEQERELASTGIVGPLWTPKPEAVETEASEVPDNEE